MVDEAVCNDIRNMIRQFNSIVSSKKCSKSQKRKLLIDYMSLSLLVDIYQIHDFKLVNIPLYDYVDQYSPAVTESHIQNLRFICEPAVQEMLKAGFYFYKRNTVKYFTYNESIEIICNFLNEFLPESLPFFCDIVENDHILCDTNLKKFLCTGMSFQMPCINQYRLLIQSSGEIHDIGTITSLIHEFIHLYSFKFLENYRSQAMINLREGFFIEAPTLFSELMLYDYLLKNGINDAIYERNSSEYVMLLSLKMMVYLGEMSSRGNYIDYYGSYVTVDGSTTFDANKGLYPFEYLRTEFDNSLYDYPLSSLAAFQMLEQTYAGDKPSKVLHELLLKHQYDHDYSKIITEDYNYKFMGEQINEHMKILRKVHPLGSYLEKK